ncbi:enoyl-CoA hydratase/isomerase family protein, partial [Variovorax sp.]|uniref:enoyl-CoA hydratase/isomerase family protein n=2 Tax=Comamonadaceae TaxID=80864 RepID=UPI000C38A991
MDYVTLETSDGIAHVRLQRPERLNAISAVVLDDLHEALREAQSSADVRAIVFSGAGRAFCA